MTYVPYVLWSVSNPGRTLVPCFVTPGTGNVYEGYYGLGLLWRTKAVPNAKVFYCPSQASRTETVHLRVLHPGGPLAVRADYGSQRQRGPGTGLLHLLPSTDRPCAARDLRGSALGYGQPYDRDYVVTELGSDCRQSAVH